jgi:hypothetical protein
MEYSQGHEPMQLTKPDPEETFAHTHQPSCETQQPPTYDPNQDERPRAHPATPESLQAPELTRYTQPEAEGTLDHLPLRPNEKQQTHPLQQGAPHLNHNRQVSSLPHPASLSDNNQNTVHNTRTSTYSSSTSPPEDRLQTVDYKKRPRDIPDCHAQNNNKLNFRTTG